MLVSQRSAAVNSLGRQQTSASFIGRGSAPLSQQFVDQGSRSRNGISERSQFPGRILWSLQHDVMSVESNAQVIACFQSESGPQISRYHQPPLLAEHDRGIHECMVAHNPLEWQSLDPDGTCAATARR
jgi:hypothetical protein